MVCDYVDALAGMQCSCPFPIFEERESLPISAIDRLEDEIDGGTIMGHLGFNFFVC